MSFSDSVSNVGKGAKAKIGDFGQWLGTEKLKKKIGTQPQRYALGQLLGEVVALQPSVDADRSEKERLETKVRTALDGLYDIKGKDISALIKSADRAAKEVEADLDALKKSVRAAEKVAKPTKSDTTASKALVQLREELRFELEVANAIPKSVGSVLLPAQYAKPTLEAVAKTIESHIAASAPDENVIRAEIDSLKVLIGKAKKDTADGRKFIKDDVPQELERAEKLLDSFGKAVNGDYQGPLRGIVEALRRVSSEIPADPDKARMLIAVAKQAGKDAATGNYIKDTNEAAIQEKNAVDLKGWLTERLSPLREEIARLRASDAPGLTAIEKKLEATWTIASKPIATDQVTPTKVAAEKSFAALAAEIKQVGDGLQGSITTSAEEVRKILQEAKKQYESLLKLHGNVKVLQADWKATDAQIGGAEAIVPLTGKIEGISLRDVTLARGLATEATTKLAAIRNDTAKLLVFDADMKTVEKQIKERSFLSMLAGADKEVLEKYDPEGRAEFEERFIKLHDQLPQTASKDAIKEFADLQAEVTQHVKKLHAVDKVLEGEARPFFQQVATYTLAWQAEASKLFRDPSEKEYTPGMCLKTIKTLSAECARRPPALDQVKTALAEAKKAYDTAAAMTKEQRHGVAKADKAEGDKAHKAIKDEKEVWKQKLKPLKDTYAAAAVAVAKIGGDQNMLDVAKRLITIIEDGIKAKAFTTLQDNLDRLKSKLNDILNNPSGEKNTKELPVVIAALRDATRTAVAGVTALADRVAEHTTTGMNEIDAQMLVIALLKSYAKLVDLDIDALEKAAAPIMDDKTNSEDERRAAQSEGLRLLRACRNGLRAQPMTSELLGSPFSDAKKGLALLFTALDKYEYTLDTCL